MTRLFTALVAALALAFGVAATANNAVAADAAGDQPQAAMDNSMSGGAAAETGTEAPKAKKTHHHKHTHRAKTTKEAKTIGGKHHHKHHKKAEKKAEKPADTGAEAPASGGEGAASPAAGQ